MNGFLLATSVITELIKAEPDRNVLRWIEETRETFLFLSVLTLGEIRSGVERLTLGRRRGRLEAWLAVDLRQRFQDRILDISDAIAERWGVLYANGIKRGRPLPVVDGLLAATALHHNLIFATRNDTDVRGTSVATFNPWQ